MRILVCGGRDYVDRARVFTVLDRIGVPRITLVIEGGARGADRFAREWAQVMAVPFKTYEANWRRLRGAAGHFRNTRMLVEGKPRLVLAFPGGDGTQDMVLQARAAGVKVWESPW